MMNRRKFFGIGMAAGVTALSPSLIRSIDGVPAITSTSPIPVTIADARNAHTQQVGSYLSDLWSKEILKAYKDNLVLKP